MHYDSYEKSKTQPNILVDGAPNEATELVLSHWPNNKTPVEFKADLSTEIVFNYLESGQSLTNAQVVTNDHFDEDGLAGIYALLNPEDALAQKDFLIDLARAGDFDLYKERDAARVCFILRGWQNPDLSPLSNSVLQQDYLSLTNVLYEELLPRLRQIIEKVDRFEKFWSAEDALLDATEESISRREITFKEYKDLDFAVVQLPDSNLPPDRAVQRMGIHNQTDCLRILLMQPNRFQFYYRYESWVELHSRKPLVRKDMQELARSLTKQESMDGIWTFDDVNALSPSLKLSGTDKSMINPDRFEEQIVQFLIA